MWPIPQRKPTLLYCDLLRLQYHRCVLPRGHTRPCHFEPLGEAPTVRRPNTNAVADGASLDRRCAPPSGEVS
jgi:hypothetical protein